MYYGYARCSTVEQKLDRQTEAFDKWFEENEIKNYQIYSDKKSGKDFERQSYQELLNIITKGDVLVIKSIDRLGRNYDMIIEQWTYITKTIGADIVVLDMPLLDTRERKENLTGKFISDIVLQLLSYVAENERNNIRQRQREGIDIALAKGVKFGREKKFTDEQINAIKVDYENGMKVTDLLKKHEISRTKMFAFVKEFGWKGRNKRG